MKSERTKRILTFCAGFLMSSVAWGVQPQPVPIPEDSGPAPQVEISGVGIVTGLYGQSAQQNQIQPGADYSDSTLQIGVAERLFSSAIGSMKFGLLTLPNEGASSQSPFFLTQAFVDYQAERIEVLIGRSDNPTAHLVDFPTLRDDDLFTLNNPLNPMSNGSSPQEHRYSNVAEVTFNQGLSYFENFHAQQVINSSGVGTSTGINSWGVTFQYLSTPGMEAFTRFPSLGFGLEYLNSLGLASGGLYQMYAGGVMNLNQSVTDRWDLRVLNILSLGSELRGFTFMRETFEADSNALSAAIRYLHSPFGKPGYQLSLTVGYKKYFKVANSTSVGFALTALKRLGEGFQLAGQYQGQWRDQALSQVQANGLPFEQVVQVGFIFNWEATLNRHLSSRRSILNQQFQYIPN